MIINKYIFKKIEGVFSSFVFNHGGMLLCHKTRFWIAPGKSRFINVFLFPHFLFRMVVMVNPRRTFSFNFQSTLDSSVDYVLVFAFPCCFVAKFLWKSPKVFPALFVSGYCPIAIVVPRSPLQFTIQREIPPKLKTLQYKLILHWKAMSLLRMRQKYTCRLRQSLQLTIYFFCSKICHLISCVLVLIVIIRQ